MAKRNLSTPLSLNEEAPKLDDQSKVEDLSTDTAPTGQLLTDNMGHVVSDDQNSLRAGVLGPTLLEDFLFREKMTAEQQQALFENTARAIDGASQASIDRHIENCTKADPAYGEGVRKAIEALQASKK